MGLLPAVTANSAEKLTGTPIGSAADGSHPISAAFDGNGSTYFRATGGSYQYVGLDLGDTYIINSVSFQPENGNAASMLLGMFEGANSPDFMDAMPIQMIKSTPADGKMNHLPVQVSRAFRYVRYVGPHESGSRIAELSFTGTKGTGDDSHLFQITNIPTVIINTPGATVPPPKTEKDLGGVHYTFIDNHQIDLDTEAPKNVIRVRGNASAKWDKKPWKVKFESKQEVLGMPKNKKWALLSNYSDRTLMRNILAFEVAKKVFNGNAWVPGCVPVDVVLNGEYQGCYQFADACNVQKNRVNIDEIDIDAINAGTLDVAAADKTGGYMIEADGYARMEPDQFRTGTYGVGYSFESPDPTDFDNPEHFKPFKEYINNFLNEIESAAKSGNYSKVREKMHVDDLLRYLIINEICANPDALWSVKMYKNTDAKDTKIHVGPVWDFDLGFANDEYTRDPYNHDGFMWDWDATSAADWEAVDEGGNFVGKKTAMREFVHDLYYNDPAIREEMKAIWKEVTENGMTAEWLLNLADETAAKIDQSQALNFKRWSINTKVHREPELFGTFEEYMDYMKNYIEKEFPHFENLIGATSSDPGVELTASAPEAIAWGTSCKISKDEFIAKDIKAGGKLTVTLNGSGQSAIYIHLQPSEDHNKNGAAYHLLTDVDDGGYWYTNISNGFKRSVILNADEVNKLKTYGLTIDMNGVTYGSCTYLAPTTEQPEDPVTPAEDLTFTENPGEGWGLYYTVSAEEFANKQIEANGKLYIKLTGNGQTAAYYNHTESGYDHNAHGSDHLIGDSHEGGKYYFTDLNGSREWTFVLDDNRVENLLTYGLRIDANNVTLDAINYTVPAVENVDMGEMWDIYTEWPRDICHGEVHIPAENFAHFTTDYKLMVNGTPHSHAEGVRQREAAAPVVSLYHRNADTFDPEYISRDGQEINNAEFAVYDGQHEYELKDITTDELKRLKKEGLYVGGQNYTLNKVYAVDKNVPTGVGMVTPEAEGPVSWYTLQGIRVDNPSAAGVYIRVQGNRSVKVMVK